MPFAPLLVSALCTASAGAGAAFERPMPISFRHAGELLGLCGGAAVAALVVVWLCGWRGRDRLHKPGAVAVLIVLTALILGGAAEAAWRASNRGSVWLKPLVRAVGFHFGVRFGLVLALAAALAAAAIVLVRRFTKPTSWPGRVFRVIVAGLVTVLVFLPAAELYFRFFYAVPMGNSLALAHRNWERRYWHPINSRGVRDAEWPRTRADLNGNRLVAVVGDSFAAGAGIENVADRSSNRLGVLLGPGYRVITVAKPGWETPDQLRALRALQVAPDIVVWSHVPNDIRDAAARSGMKWPRARRPRGRWGALVRDSYLVNFLYWRWGALGRNRDARADQRHNLQRAYGWRTAWSRHAADLAQVLDWTNRNGASLVVVVFPYLDDLPGTKALSGQVAAFFRDRGVPVIDMGEELADEDPRDLVVSAIDSHPSRAVHARAAGLVHRALTDRPVQPGPATATRPAP